MIEPTTYEGFTGSQLREGAEYLAGGTDVVPLLRSGVRRPGTLVDLKSEPGPPSGIDATQTGWHVGAGTTLAAIEDHPELSSDLGVLSQSAASAATRQIRNRATIGGNLLQRSRCSYFRDPAISCWLKGGDHCPAASGLHEHHAIVETGPCITTHPSDPAVALLALDATVTYELDGSSTSLLVADLLADPTEERRELHRLPPGAVLQHLDVPTFDGPSVYLKAMDRAAWQFALVSVAAVRSNDDVTVVVGGVAPTPLRLDAVTERLGSDWGDSSIAAAADAATLEFSPRERSRYKVPLLRGLVERALESLRP